METFSFLIRPFEFDEDFENHIPVVSSCLKNNYITYWESIDSSQMVLSIIRHGYYLPLTEDLACVNFKSP